MVRDLLHQASRQPYQNCLMQVELCSFYPLNLLLHLFTSDLSLLVFAFLLRHFARSFLYFYFISCVSMAEYLLPRYYGFFHLFPSSVEFFSSRMTCSSIETDTNYSRGLPHTDTICSKKECDAGYVIQVV